MVFRLPSALDNRPLMYDEYINKNAKFLFVSATPSDTELELSEGHVAEQIIRPTGLLDPIIEVCDSEYQVERLHDEIKKVVKRNERVLVTVLTKKMAEELTTYYNDLGLKVKYMHSDIDAIERNQIIRQLRLGKFDVLIGINLLREGLDIPEASLVAILDADKEGFLRSRTSLVQTMGRAARNENGKVLLFAKKMTESMKFAIETTTKRRELQDAFNKEHGITPKTTVRKLDEDLKMEEYDEVARKREKMTKMPASERQKMLVELNKQMTKAAKDLNFEEAIRLRDEIEKIKKL
jgi:excinuclease ABC subunit B